MSWRNIIQQVVNIYRPGLVPTLPNDATKVLNGLGAWSTVAGAGGVTTYTSAYSSPPASPNAGDVWFVAGGQWILRYTGVKWVPWDSVSYTNPNEQTFSWVNQGVASVSNSNGAIVLTAPGAGGRSYSMRLMAIPSIPYTLDAVVMVQGVVNNTYTQGGICIQNSVSGKINAMGIWYFPDIRFGIRQLSSPTAFNTDLFGPTWSGLFSMGLIWYLRIVNDGTNRKYYISLDRGFNYQQVYTELNNVYFVEDQFGIFLDAEHSNATTDYLTLLSYKIS